MPSHLEQFPIDIDEELEKWELEHEAEYTASKAAQPATLERCEAEQKAALKNQRENVLIKLFLRFALRSGVYRAAGPPGSYIGGSSDQIVIPIRNTTRT
ncbi:uncharacterized protein BDZ99DRAFT_102727 [Mytilinidion resinicola]|uniref:Uncharacterized protein n=1 Tax=Mytilinidion resinicola TaxID=574789 RepID=A0A6A6YB48_9PEZI|nr:uncharacterized protein BDZ99DRAFT_102727 [Mytilinidion resinicola]KAF2806041.1 hypothetical protein BDZ99DRAFT_102727 [Mytilinidion resinicola]